MRKHIFGFFVMGIIFILISFPRSSLAQVIQDGPPLLSIGAGIFDVVRQDDMAADFRLEYRHNKGLWIFLPWLGAEATSDGALYGVAGFYSDFHIGKRIVITPSVGVGAYYEGSGLDLGNVLEIRSQIEVAYIFENKSRIGLAFSHLSDAGISDDNRGTEISTIYYSIPLENLF